MAQDYEQLQKRIEDGLDAIRELKKLAAEEKERERPKLKLVRGGLLGGAIWAGVEWLRSYKLGVALVATAATAVSGVIAEQPHSPGADPPAQAIKQPAEPRPSVLPSQTPRTVVPSPRRTSPPRTPQAPQTTVPMRIAPPADPAKPTRRPAVKPTITPKQVPKPVAPKPTVSITVTPTLESPTLPQVPVEPACTIDLLGVEVCLPLG